MKNLLLTFSLLFVFVLNAQNYQKSSAGQPTGSSAEVGITTGQLSVSLTGGATYQIPIAVPSGINGVVPQLSLVYNSQGGNGAAGYGWNLSGISSITRIPTTKFHDGFIDGVDFDSNDRFALDGQRLILKSGTYGKNTAVYETENFSNIKIVSYGDMGQPAAYFKVFFPNGNVAIYGGTADSTNKNIWSIKKWYNPQDIRITYYYTKTDNSLYIDKIHYGKKSSDAALNSVEFIYKTRNRPEQAFVNGMSFKNTKILSEIKVKGNNNNNYRTYTLEHNITSLGYERLTNVIEKSGIKSYNPTLFTYDSTNNDNLFYHTRTDVGLTDVNAINTNYIAGDFNGDSKMDIITYPKTGIHARKKYSLITNANNGSYSVPIERNIDKFENMFTINWLNNNILNHKQGWVTTHNQNGTYKFKVHSHEPSNPTKFQYEKVINDFPIYNISANGCVAQNNGVYSKKMLSGDFNGDGVTDILAIDTTLGLTCQWFGGVTLNDSKKVYFIDLKKETSSDFWSLIGNLESVLPKNKNDYDIQVADFNGDGKSDFFIIQENKMIIYSLDHNNNLITLARISYDNDIDKSKPHLLGDYNGDGKIDIVMPTTVNQDRWAFYFSKGNGFQKKIGSIGEVYIEKQHSVDDFYYIANDINSDGKTDIIKISSIFYTPRNRENSTIDLLENNIVNSSTISFNHSTKNFGTLTGSYHPLPVFLNQNNLNQNLELGLLGGSKIHHFRHSKDHRQDVLLRQITTGNGVVETINYHSLTENNNDPDIQVYRTSNMERHPFVDLKNIPAIQVVSKLEKQSYNQYSKKLFSYFGAVSNVEGLGFLGFKSMLRSNWFHDGVNPIISVTKQDMTKRGAIYESYSAKDLLFDFEVTPSSFITKTVNNYSSNLSSRKVYTLRKTLSINYNKLQNTSVRNTIVYDSYNNLKTRTSTTRHGGATQHVQTTNLIYQHNPNDGSSLNNPYYIGLVKQKNIQTTASGDMHSTEERYQFNNTLLQIQKKYKGYNTPFITEDFKYDTFGNVIKKTITASGTSRVNSCEYDTSGRFLKKETDVEGLNTHYEYDPNGNLLKVTNSFGLTNLYSYDTWDKRIREIDYLGNQTVITYSRTESINSLIHITNPDGSRGYKKFDDLGREVITGAYGLNAKWAYTKTNYDIYNRKISVSEPYFGSPSQYNTSTYDSYGRIEQTQNTTGKTTNISYNGLATTVTDGYKTITTTKNSLGQIVRIMDNGGAINYYYFAHGGLKRTATNITVTTMEYDGWGRKTKLTDPSAGTYRYEYNAFGETTKEITPKGETSFILDIGNGKLIQKNVQGDATNMQSSYIYDSSTKLLKSISVNNGTTYTYTYDSYKRLNKTVEAYIPQVIFERSTTFDNLGRISTERYKAKHLATNKTSDVTIRNEYKNGSLSQIRNNSNQNLLWKTNSINEKGQITDADFGNGIKELSSYDAYGLPTSIRSVKSNTTLIDLNFTFNAQLGILTGRSNNLYSHNETFQYDNLNRLTRYTDSNGNQQTQSYDGKGRITKNAVGKFAYANATKPYQNTSIDLSGDLYLNNKALQNITYNAFKAPVKISTEVGQNSREEISFGYNVFQKRSSAQFKKFVPQEIHYKTKFYTWDGTMEITKEVSTEFITYIGGDAYTAPIVYKSNGSTGKFLYLHRDYLGSIIAISNSQGTLIEKRHFDAWGKVAMIKDQYGNTLDKLTTLDRGYTGHEHLESVDLINMNARLYDANLHRFLAPDNFVQDPFNTQNFNRYSYVLNNPLSYVDQNGEFLWFAVAIGALIGGISQAINGGNFGDILFGAVSGAIIGAVSAGVGNLAAGGSFFGSAAANVVGFNAGFVAGAAAGAVGGFLSGAVNTWYNGGSFSNGIFNGVQGAARGGIFGGVSGGIFGGVRANKMGLNFWDGMNPSNRTTRFMIASGYNPGDPISPTDANLIKARNAWIPDAPMENVNKFTVENVSENMQLLMDNKGAGAATVPLAKNRIFTGNSNMYFNKNLAFTSAKELYYTMTHEFIHVSQHALLEGISTNIITSAFVELQELSAYSYQSSLGSSNYGGFNAADIRSLSQQFPTYYNQFQFYNFSWTSTVQYINVNF